MNRSSTLTAVVLTFFVGALLLFGYDRWIAQPAQVIGVVDLQRVIRAGHASLLPGVAAGDEQAPAQAQAFGQRLDEALKALPAECGCLVLERSAIVGESPRVLDLTPALARKLGLGT